MRTPGDQAAPVDAGRDRAVAWVRALVSTREEVCRALSEGDLELAEVLDDRATPELAEVHVLAILESLPGASKVATRRALDACGIAHRTPLGDLDEHGIRRIQAAFPTSRSTGGVGQ